MEQIRSWEADSSSLVKKFPQFMKPKGVHNSPPLTPALCDSNPVHTLPFYPSTIYFNIIHSSIPYIFLVMFPSGFQPKTCYAT